MKKNTPINIYALTIVPLFTSLIIVGAYIKIPFPLVPLTLQTLFVLLAAMLLKPKYAVMVPALYMFLGLAGLPVFTKGGGLFYIFEPTFGYILGFLPASFLVSFLVSKFQTRSIPLLALIGVSGISVIYVTGMVYMYLIMNYYTNNPIGFIGMFSSNFMLSITGDILKCIASALISVKLYAILKNIRLFSGISNFSG